MGRVWACMRATPLLTPPASAANTAFRIYKAGVFTASSCDATTVTHSLLVVGYNTTASPPYWLVKNSWGTTWGELVPRGLRAEGGRASRCCIPAPRTPSPLAPLWPPRPLPCSPRPPPPLPPPRQPCRPGWVWQD